MNLQPNEEMPNLFVIGAAKCGTTSLHHYLGLHPEISMSSIKEPLFFLPQEFRDSWRHSPVAGSREEYLALFESGTRVRGEASTWYSMFPFFKGVPARIHAAAPEARLVYLVGDPVERIPAAWVQRMGGREASHRGEDGPIPLAEHIGEFDHPRNLYTWPGMYTTQIRQYLDHFPRESLLVVDSDELRNSRQETMKEIFAFLGVDPDFFDSAFVEEKNTHSEKKLESAAYVRLTRSTTLRRLVDRMPDSLRDRMIETARKPLMVTAEKPELDPELRSRLEDWFRPEVEELRAFTGKPFAGWSI